MLKKGAAIRSLFGMKKITRAHCIFDTNIKMKIVNKKMGETVFGSKYDENKSDELNRNE